MYLRHKAERDGFPDDASVAAFLAGLHGYVIERDWQTIATVPPSVRDRETPVMLGEMTATGLAWIASGAWSHNHGGGWNAGPNEDEVEPSHWKPMAATPHGKE